MINAQKPYRHALVFAGGGMRFGYYLGVYQAFYEQKGVPDVIIASCGGALMSAVLHTTSHPKTAYQLLSSPACYQLCCRLYGKVPPSALTYSKPAFFRWWHWQKSKYQPSIMAHSVTQDELSALFVSLFAIKDDILWQQQAFDNLLSSLDVPSSPKINSLMVLSRLGDDGRWQQVLRPSHAWLSDYLTWQSLPCALFKYNPQRIHPQIAIHQLPLGLAVNIGVSDMYYLSPMSWQGHHWLGGVMDLTPVEVASALADEVWIDDKPHYQRWLAEPAIFSCFGFSANQRLEDVKRANHTAKVHWLPLADCQRLPAIVGKRYDWRQGYIKGVYPDFAKFQHIIHQQWQYGYERTKAYLMGMT